MKTELAAAYAATTYRIHLPEGAVNLRPGELNPRLAAWMAASGHDCFAIVTAHNPASQRLGAYENRERQAELECDLLEAGFVFFAAENVPDGDWPVEAGAFIPDIALDDALAFAEGHGQLAILWGGDTAMPELRWTDLAG